MGGDRNAEVQYSLQAMSYYFIFQFFINQSNFRKWEIDKVELNYRKL